MKTPATPSAAALASALTTHLRRLEADPRANVPTLPSREPVFSDPVASAKGGGVRVPYARLEDWMRAMPAELRSLKQAEAEALFTAKGYKNNVAHETIRTYDKWIEAGLRVKRGEKSLKTTKGVALFHLDQVAPIGIAAKAN